MKLNEWMNANIAAYICCFRAHTIWKRLVSNEPTTWYVLFSFLVLLGGGGGGGGGPTYCCSPGSLSRLLTPTVCNQRVAYLVSSLVFRRLKTSLSIASSGPGSVRLEWNRLIYNFFEAVNLNDLLHRIPTWRSQRRSSQLDHPDKTAQVYLQRPYWTVSCACVERIRFRTVPSPQRACTLTVLWPDRVV